MGYVLVVLVAVGATFRPEDLAWDGALMLRSPADVPMGDHVQIAYYLWLWGHSLATFAHHPWADPFQFAATGHLTYQVSGWPLALVSLPVQAVAGPIAAYNAVLVTSFVGTAGTTFLLARELGSSRHAAAVAGFALAFAPFRITQLGHMNALLLPLLPLTLFLCERALRGPDRSSRQAGWAAAAVHVSLLASGELHLALYGTMLLVAFVVFRGWSVDRARLRWLAPPAVALVVGSAAVLALVYAVVLAPSVRGANPPVDEVAHYAPRLENLWTRESSGERDAYPGLAIMEFAAIGVAVTMTSRVARRRRLTLFLVSVTIASWVLAVLPSWEAAREVHGAIPIISQSRTPGRIIALASIALALLVASGIDFIPPGRWRLAIAALAITAILVDGAPDIGGTTQTGSEPLAAVPLGAAVLELPPFPPDDARGSRYMASIMARPGPRAGGYSVLVTPEAAEAQRATWTLVDTPLDQCRWKEVAGLVDIDYVAVHLPLFGEESHQWPTEAPGQDDSETHGSVLMLVTAMDRLPAFARVAEDDGVILYIFDAQQLGC